MPLDENEETNYIRNDDTGFFNDSYINLYKSKKKIKWYDKLVDFMKKINA